MVIFLSAGLAEQVQKSLLEGGYGEDVPVAVVFKATWPEERIVRTTLKNLAADMEREQNRPYCPDYCGKYIGSRV